MAKTNGDTAELKRTFFVPSLHFWSPLHYATTVVALVTLGVVSYLLVSIPPDLLPFDKIFVVVFGNSLICLGMFRSARDLNMMTRDGRRWLLAFITFCSVQILGFLFSLMAYVYMMYRGVYSLTLGQPVLLFLVWFSLAAWFGARVLCCRAEPAAFLSQLRMVARGEKNQVG